MNLEFKSNKLKKICEDPRLAQKEYGQNIGKKLTQRVVELDRAISLKDISRIPAARLHPLQGNRAGEYGIDLVHPFRLVIKPIVNNDNEISKLELIKIVRIEEVIDYHGKQKGK